MSVTAKSGPLIGPSDPKPYSVLIGCLVIAESHDIIGYGVKKALVMSKGWQQSRLSTLSLLKFTVHRLLCCLWSIYRVPASILLAQASTGGLCGKLR